jgi:hypothetical protein
MSEETTLPQEETPLPAEGEMPASQPSLSEEQKVEGRRRFRTALAHLINAANVDNDLGIADFILADYIMNSLDVLKGTLSVNKAWREIPGEPVNIGCKELQRGSVPKKGEPCPTEK